MMRKEWVILGCFILSMGCSQPVEVDENTYSGAVDIQFQGVSQSQSIQPGVTYLNGWNEPFTVSRFQFYISSIRFEQPDSNRSEPVIGETYFLVDALGGISQTIATRTNSRSYQAISFLLGVDSIRNVSGAQTGALDPGNGMFWTWNSGYIMAKLEGNSTVSNQVNGKMEYHIGGFSGAQNTLKRITLILPTSVVVTGGKKPVIRIQADVNAWFQAPHNLTIRTQPVCTTPGALAKQFADNYADMFTVREVINP